jgi:hypothetical protein
MSALNETSPCMLHDIITYCYPVHLMGPSWKAVQATHFTDMTNSANGLLVRCLAS